MSQQNKNYYEVLGATPTASIEQMRAAYRDKVRIIHPDSAVVASPTASLQMAEVVRAWSTLSDPILRRAYDAELLVHMARLMIRFHRPQSCVGIFLRV